MHAPAVIEKFAQRAAGLFGLKLVQDVPPPPPEPPPRTPSPWEVDAKFQDLVRLIGNRSLLTHDRLFMIYQYARLANARQGDIAEVGVYRGGTAKLLARTCPDTTIHLFDTFAGMPQADASIDRHKKGDFADTSLAQVQDFLSDCPRVDFHPGFFPDTAGPVRDRQFSLVHVDADIYQSTKDCLLFVYDRRVPGGVMIFDDYEWPGCPGVRRALDEFLADRREVPIVTTQYQCALYKA
jgi:O-methyltransferase